jgi:hypothetical protein
MPTVSSPTLTAIGSPTLPSGPRRLARSRRLAGSTDHFALTLSPTVSSIMVG